MVFVFALFFKTRTICLHVFELYCFTEIFIFIRIIAVPIALSYGLFYKWNGSYNQ